MSHFYSEIVGSHGEATRQGTKQSGIVSHIRGWDVGVRVSGMVDSNGDDVFTIVLTSGSGDDLSPVFLGSYTRADLKDMLDRREDARPIDTTKQSLR